MSKHVNNPINLWEEEQIADNKKLKKKNKNLPCICVITLVLFMLSIIVLLDKTFQ